MINMIKKSSLCKIMFPGTVQPGVAKVEINENGFSFSNDVLYVNFIKTGASFKLSSVENKITREIHNATMNNLFILIFSDNSQVCASEMTIKSGPNLVPLVPVDDSIRLADRDEGKKLQTVFEYNKDGKNLEVTWDVVLVNNSNNLRQQFTFNAKKTDLSIKSYLLFDMNILGKELVKVNKDSGSPVVLGNIFLGVESPLSNVNIDRNYICIYINSARDLKPNSPIIFTTGIGVSPSNQLKRAFRYYLERERIHFRRPLLMYNSWWTFPMNDYDINYPELEVGETVQPTEKELSEIISMYGENLGSRGVVVDSYQIDDGWDDVEGTPIWSFNKNSLPSGFKELKKIANKFNGNLGLWMSPFGGYAGSDHRASANPDLGPISGRFRLSNEKYYDVFKNTVFDMIDNHGVTAFKFDGVGAGLNSSGPSDENIKEYENLLSLLKKIREHSPDVFIYCTVGTWASPYWLWYTDSIWRDEDDQGLIGEGTGAIESSMINRDREQWINYRDNAIYRHNVVENPYMTINELMTHGVVYSTYSNYRFNNDLSDQRIKDSLLHDMKMLFALGGSLEELHIQKDQIDILSDENKNFIWDNLAKNITWTENNFSLLSDNQWVGGSPAKGEVYGFASWSKDKSILSLRNPSRTEKVFMINPQEIFNIPNGESTGYLFIERDMVIEPVEILAGKTADLTIKPFDVLILESSEK